MPHKVLLIEDSKEIYNLVKAAISSPLIDLQWTEDLLSSRKVLENNKFDLILLDIELPDGNGIELCNEILANSPKTSIFFLTANDNLSEKVLGFSAGAEDYITKPFNGLELKARIEAKLKKLDILKTSSDHFKWSELEIDKSKQEVFLFPDTSKRKVDLTALEFKLLSFFANKVFEVIDRDTILNEIWGENIHVYSRSVDTHVSKLRKKLEDASHIIESVHGAGYKFKPTEVQ